MGYLNNTDRRDGNSGCSKANSIRLPTSDRKGEGGGFRKQNVWQIQVAISEGWEWGLSKNPGL